MPLNIDSLRLQQDLRTQIDRILDQHTRTQLRAWIAAWDEVAPDLQDTLEELIGRAEDGAVSRRTLRRSRRLQKALSRVAVRLQQLIDASQVSAVGNLRRIVQQAGIAQAGIIAAQLPTGQDLVDLEAWTRVDQRAIDAIVRRSTQQITARHRPLSRQAYQAVSRELVRGIAAGTNPRQTARRIVARAEDKFSGGMARANVIARTEQIDAHRAGAQLGQAEHGDVLAGWTWLAKLTARTCRSCFAMHGRVFPLSVAGPDDHPQGRCSRAPKTRSWRDLGFDIDEPADDVDDAEEFFDRLPKADQVKILGRDGYDAWVAGDYPFDDWAVRQVNDGWRDSVVPSKPPGKAPGGHGGGGGRPPRGRSGASASSSEPDPPIGPVLGTPEQQRYRRSGEPAAPVPRLDSANAAHVYIADPRDRLTAMLQYLNETERAVKRTARDLRDVGKPTLEASAAVAYGYGQLVEEFGDILGITSETYTYEDFLVDVNGAAQRLLDLPEVRLGRVFRVLTFDEDYDLGDADQQQTVLDRVLLTDWNWASGARDVQIVTPYMSMSTTTVILVIDGARGVDLGGVGRMSSQLEVLVSGGMTLDDYTVTGRILTIYGRWRQ